MSDSPPSRPWTRRRLLQAGALWPLGLYADGLARWRAAAQERGTGSRQRANACVFVFLFGGPSHIDLWDLKPAAPREIRGEFRPAATNVPGILIAEHLPRLARQMDKLCLLRSMTHHMNVHGPACSELYSGREYFGPPVTDQARPEDWPSLAALVKRFGRQHLGLPSSVTLPWYTQFVGQSRRIAGQTGGRMGEEFNPFLIQGDVRRADFEVQGVKLPPDVSLDRLRRRRALLERLDPSEGDPAASELRRRVQRHYDTAFSMIESSQVAGAFDLGREPARMRDLYGRTHIGQSLLLARRLVEAGVSLVTVNWDDAHKDDKVSPHWDTHVDNFPKLKDRLCPPFDRAMSAFVSDMADRGLLETTLVVATGEFGRTPRVGAVTQNGMTKPTGRDHWPHAFTALLAGGGVRGGTVYGSTGKTGGYVKDHPATPADLAATILDHLGIDPSLEYDDHILGIRQKLSIGKPVPGIG